MKVLVLFALVGLCCGADLKYVFDAMKIFDANEVASMLAAAKPGETYPNLAQIPDSAKDYDCKGKQGFYADVDSKCQVFHRCDVNGNHTAYLCTNTTIFNQVTLICDYYFNVDCDKSNDYANFANSRLYTDQPLFDTPPADYVVPAFQKIIGAQQRSIEGGAPSNQPSGAGGQAKPGKQTPKPAAGKGAATTAAPKGAATTKPAGGKAAATTAATTTPTTAAASEATTAAAGEESTTAAGGESTTAAAGEETTSAAGGESTTAAGGEETTSAAAGGEETTAAAGGEATTAAGGEETTAAAGGETTAAGGEHAGEEETTAAAEETTTTAA